MLTPFQRLLQYSLTGTSSRNILLAASGPCLRAFDGSTGHFISKWTHLDHQNTNSAAPQNETPDESPTKKRKLDNGNTSDTPSAEIVIENGSGRRKPKRHGFTVPCITHMLGTTDGKHVVLVTGEDKSIRVLSMSEGGVMHQISQRVLPKRPSALSLTPDENTILCSDKFGDVYSLPLLGLPFELKEIVQQAEINNAGLEEMYQPSATSKTVHTKRNLRALESQQRQKKVKKQEKPQLSFEYQLLLGHVSLLTDIACVRIESTEYGKRTFILTADRDEHIRVSRGIPQAHIIENFCLGHEQFISKIHIPKWQANTLISGGGDDYLLVWDWQNGSVRQEIDLAAHTTAQRPVTTESQVSHMAVSGIWSMETSNGAGQIVVAFESATTLLFFDLSADGRLVTTPSFSTKLPHNILDVAACPYEQIITVSMDNAHQPCRTHDSATSMGSYMTAFHYDGIWSQIESPYTQAINDFASETTEPLTDSLDASALGDIFYNIEHLRKRGGNEGIDEEP